MNENDIEFLKELQNEMNNQNTYGQANPRFWVVRQTVREYGYDSDYSDNYMLYYGEGDATYETIEDCYELLCDFDYKLEEFGYEDISIELNDSKNTITIKARIEESEKHREWCLHDLYDVENFINNKLFLCDVVEIIYYKDKEEIVEDTFFLTLKECEEHIKNNYHHYNKPHPYAMTAWRSPQVNKLYEILQNTNWDKLKNKV